ncbi:MAG: hypothetical protein AAGA29_14470 [Planctomycetota bacterium]
MARFAAVLLCVLIGGHSVAQAENTQPNDVDGAGMAEAGQTPEGEVRRDLPLPPGLPRELKPEQGQGRDTDHVDRSVEEALAEVEPASFPRQAQADPDAELSPLAQRLLDRALALMHDGRNFDAIEGLHEAEQIAPDHPQVVRALGLAYVHGGNHVRGRDYLRRAAGLDPADTDVRVLLARLALEREAWDEAIAYAAAVDLADAAGPGSSPAALCVADYVRAVVLDERGDALAAISLYERVLASQVEPAPVSPAGREFYIIRERGADIYQRVGDLQLKRGEPTAALSAYRQADIAAVNDPAALAARRVYSQLVMGQEKAAAETAVAFLASPHATEFDAQLISYLVDQGVEASSLDAQIVAAQATAPAGHFPLVAARAAVLPQAQTVALIDAWLADQPARLDTFRRAIALLRGGGATKDDPQALARALTLTATAMRREPRRASEYADGLLGQRIDAVALIRAMRLPAVRDTEDVMLLRLTADGYFGVGRYDDAASAYARALVCEPEDVQTQLAFARLLIGLGPQDRGKFAHAATLLGEVGFDDAWERFAIYIDYLRFSAEPGPLPEQANAVERRAHERQTRRHAMNLSAAQQMIAKRLERHPSDLDLLLLQPMVAAEANYMPQAIEMMRSLLVRFPTREDVYITGMNLYNAIQPGRNYDRDLNLYLDFYFDLLLPRLAQYLPRSRTARQMEINNLIDRAGAPALALPIIESLLEDDPYDSAALDAMVDAYTALGDAVRAAEARQRWIDLLPQGVVQTYERIRLAYANDDKEAVAALVREVFALDAEGVLPGRAMTGEIAASLLVDLSWAVGREAAQADSLQQLARFPDNAALNNSLGYQWAVDGKELLAAEVMIQRALDAEPEVSSYLDSMAWVLYKLGRFEEAQAYMTQAIARQRIEHRAFEVREGEHDPRSASKAVLLDHMGDILYAQGNVAGARSSWRTASAQDIAPESAAADPETATVVERCLAKLAALASGNEPPVSEVPGEAAHGSGVHPADRD